jgi:hypothetical protein
MTLTDQIKAEDSLCTNCGKPITGTGVMSPTLDEKRRNQCRECAKEWLKTKDSLREQIDSVLQELCSWDPEVMRDEEYQSYRLKALNEILKLIEERLPKEHEEKRYYSEATLHSWHKGFNSCLSTIKENLK